MPCSGTLEGRAGRGGKGASSDAAAAEAEATATLRLVRCRVVVIVDGESELLRAAVAGLREQGEEGEHDAAADRDRARESTARQRDDDAGSIVVVKVVEFGFRIVDVVADALVVVAAAVVDDAAALALLLLQADAIARASRRGAAADADVARDVLSSV